MLAAVGLLLLNASLAPVAWDDGAAVGATGLDADASLPAGPDPFLALAGATVTETGSADGLPPGAQPAADDASVLPEAGPVRPPPPPLPQPLGINIGLPCFVVAGDAIGAKACGGDVLNAVLPPARPPVTVPKDAAPAPPVAPMEAQVTPGQAAAKADPFASEPHPVDPQPPVGAAPRPAVDPATAAGGPGRGGRDDALGWIAAATAAALAPALLLLKVMASFAVRRLGRSSPRREALLALVRAEPGIHHTELVRRTGFGNGAVQHHLRALADGGLVVRVRTAGHSCFFPAAADADLMGVRVAARAPLTRQVLALLAARPRTLAALARDLGLPVTTVHYHVAKLAAAGALARSDAHGRGALSLTDLGVRALGAQQAGAGLAAGHV